MSNKTELILQSIHRFSGTETAFQVAADEIIRVLDVAGEQVVDQVCISVQNPAEYLSSGRTIDYNNKIYLTIGGVLYSDRSSPMLTIMEDMVGTRDFLLSPCSPDMLCRTYSVTTPHPHCLENLSAVLAPFGIQPSIIPVAFNEFMNASVSDEGENQIAPPRSEAGDYIDFQGA